MILGAPGQPVISTLVSTSTAITVRWLPLLSNGGYPMTNLSYNVEYLQSDSYQENDCSGCMISPSINNFYFLMDNLRIGKPYSLRIKATNPGGTSYSGWRKINTKGMKILAEFDASI